MAAEMGGAEGPSQSNLDVPSFNGFSSSDSIASLKIGSKDIPIPMEDYKKW